MRRLVKRRTYYQRQNAILKAPLHKMPPTPYPVPRKLRRWETLAKEVALSGSGHRQAALLTMWSSTGGEDGGAEDGGDSGGRRPPAAEDSVRWLSPPPAATSLAVSQISRRSPGALAKEGEASATPPNAFIAARSGSAEVFVAAAAEAAEVAAAEVADQWVAEQEMATATAPTAAALEVASVTAEANVEAPQQWKAAAVAAGEEQVPLRSTLQQWQQRNVAPDMVYRLAALQTRARGARRLREASVAALSGRGTAARIAAPHSGAAGPDDGEPSSSQRAAAAGSEHDWWSAGSGPNTVRQHAARLERPTWSPAEGRRPGMPAAAGLSARPPHRPAFCMHATCAACCCA